MAEATESDYRAELEEVRAWAGHRLDGLTGEPVGKVEGVLVDDARGAPEWLLARMGRFGHYTLVPARDAVEGVGHVWVPYTREQIRAAPHADQEAELTVAGERELLEHYGIAVDAGRAAELAERDGDAISAVAPRD
jgi:hypothetical protein